MATRGNVLYFFDSWQVDKTNNLSKNWLQVNRFDSFEHEVNL